MKNAIKQIKYIRRAIETKKMKVERIESSYESLPAIFLPSSFHIQSSKD